MRAEAVEKFLGDRGQDRTLVQRLLAEGLLVETEYRGMRFYLRRFGTHQVRP